jgi:hypothetical protein
MASGVVLLPLVQGRHHHRTVLSSAGVTVLAVAIPHLVIGSAMLATVSAGGQSTFTWLGGALLATGATASLLGLTMFAVGSPATSTEETTAPRRPGRSLMYAGITTTIIAGALGVAGGSFMIASSSARSSDWIGGDGLTLSAASLGLLGGSVLALAIGIPMIVVGSNQAAHANVSVSPAGVFASGDF